MLLHGVEGDIGRAGNGRNRDMQVRFCPGRRQIKGAEINRVLLPRRNVDYAQRGAA